MHARCSICQDILDDANTPMTTLCGHLYCVECATYQFANGDVCAICRTGPYGLDALIKLYPDYEREPERPPSPPEWESGRGMRSDGVAVEVGMGVMHACHEVLESEDVLESPALGSALERTDDLLEALENIDTQDIRNLLLNVTSLLQDIRTKALDTSRLRHRLPDLEAQRDHLQLMARRLTERIHVLQRSRDSDREAATIELESLRQEWAEQMAELREDLQETTSLLNIERAKVDQTRVVITGLDADTKKLQAQAAKYKKKHRTLKKKLQAMEMGIQDAFFGGDESLESI